jgi:RimJ/RimL family protein N-acetyltransferase
MTPDSAKTNPPCIFLRGFRTYLRPLEPTDAPIIYIGINDPESWKYLSSAALLPKGIGFEEEWIKEKQKPNSKDITLAICVLETHEFIGTMGLHQIDYVNRTAITGSVIFKEEYRSKGYGTDAKMALLNHCFNHLNLRLIESRVIAFNGRSARYSKKCGYKIDATLRQRHEREGKIHDELILSVTREDWLLKWEAYRSLHETKAES